MLLQDDILVAAVTKLRLLFLMIITALVVNFNTKAGWQRNLPLGPLLHVFHPHLLHFLHNFMVGLGSLHKRFGCLEQSSLVVLQCSQHSLVERLQLLRLLHLSVLLRNKIDSLLIFGESRELLCGLYAFLNASSNTLV